MQRGEFRGQRGQSMTEFIIITPVLLILVFGALQFALIFQAKTTLNYAAFEAARAGALNNADPAAIENALARGLAALYTHDNTVEKVSAARERVRKEISGDASRPPFVQVEIINPSTEAYADHGIEVDGDCQIPNDNLMYRARTVGSASNQTIQDANLLKLRITYCYPLHVPFVNRLLATLLTRAPSADCPECTGAFVASGSFERACLNNNRFPINAQAIVRMHSPSTIPGKCP
jgi:hypothetical protein